VRSGGGDGRKGGDGSEGSSSNVALGPHLISDNSIARRVLFVCSSVGNVSALRVAVLAGEANSAGTGGRELGSAAGGGGRGAVVEMARLGVADLNGAIRISARYGHIATCAYLFAMLSRRVSALVSQGGMTADHGEYSVCASLFEAFDDAATGTHVKLAKDLSAMLCSRGPIAAYLARLGDASQAAASGAAAATTAVGSEFPTAQASTAGAGAAAAAQTRANVGYGQVAGLNHNSAVNAHGGGNAHVGGTGDDGDDDGDDDSEDGGVDRVVKQVGSGVARVLENLSRAGHVDVATVVIQLRVSDLVPLDEWEAVLMCAAANGRGRIVEVSSCVCVCE
jgi:hypothetical protein